MITEAIFGLDSPVISDVPQSRFYWRWLSWLGSGGRNRVVENLRVAQISQLIIRYTKDVAVDMTPVAHFRLQMQELLYPGEQTLSAETTPAKVRLLLQELGPTFVKLGQMVTSRAEILPKEWRAEFERLQSDVAPFPYDEAVKIIEHELGPSSAALLATLEKEPFAAASTAQVHRATLEDGTPVVVKVQRPDIDATCARRAERQATWPPSSRQPHMGTRGRRQRGRERVRVQYCPELNYENELLNMRMLAQKHVRVPAHPCAHCLPGAERPACHDAGVD